MERNFFINKWDVEDGDTFQCNRCGNIIVSKENYQNATCVQRVTAQGYFKRNVTKLITCNGKYKKVG